MPRSRVQANAIALPASQNTVNRRTALLGAAAVAIAATDIGAAANADPVHALIQQYRDGVAAYDATDTENYSNDECDALAERLYRPYLNAMSAPLPAVTTREGAKAALLLIREECVGFSDSPIVPHLTDALLAWVCGNV